MATVEELDAVLIKSLVLLEWRLKRLEFLLSRADQEEDAGSNSLSVIARLDRLEKKWQKLGRQEKVVGAMSDLYRGRRELFTATKGAVTPQEASLPPSALQISTLQMLSPQITEAASALGLLELSFPPTSSFTTLACLAPRMSALEDRQISQALEISELRKRSMMAVSRYKKVHIEGQREVWREWGGMMSSLEREIGREEARREKEHQ